MSKNYRSVLWQELDLAVGPLRLRDLTLHRHLPETTSLGEHRHRDSQFLLYLAGHGIQRVAKREVHAGAGTLVAIPPGVPHAFRRSGKRPALCLVIDFRLTGGTREPAMLDLSALELAGVRETLAKIARLPEGDTLPWEVSRATLVLQLLEPLLRATGWFPGAKPEQRSPVVHRVARLLRDPTSDELSLGTLAGRAGYQRDYLNRILKSETGLTLGQWRSRERVNRARALLQRGLPVGETAAAVNLPDQNYFARWFKEQTGTTPSQWRSGGKPHAIRETGPRRPGSTQPARRDAQ